MGGDRWKRGKGGRQHRASEPTILILFAAHRFLVVGTCPYKPGLIKGRVTNQLFLGVKGQLEQSLPEAFTLWKGSSGMIPISSLGRFKFFFRVLGFSFTPINIVPS